MATLQIGFNEEQLTVLASYYKEEQKRLLRELASVNEILEKVEKREGPKKRGRKSNAEKLGEALTVTTGKKRGPKPGTKRTKPYTGKKRGRKPKLAVVSAED